MKRKYNSLIIFYILCICIIVGIGASAAFFTSFTNSEDGSTIVAKGGTMSVSYSNSSGDIVMENVYPKEEAWVTKTFTITGKKTTLVDMKYRLILSIEDNTFTYPITYSISGIAEHEFGIDELVNASNIQVNKNGYQVMGEGSFSEAYTGNNTHEYTLKLFYKSQGNFNQNVDQEANFAAKVVIDDGLQELPSSLIGKMLGVNNSNVKSTYVTKPGSQIATTDEGLIKDTDDYGDMYYYRGNVQNNYIVFANMCWRIVRTTGNGGIKIVMYSPSETCSSLSYGAFAIFGQPNPFQFNNNAKNNKSVGVMYGSDDPIYEEAQANVNKSIFLNNLENWYKNRITSYTDKLEDSIWCNDKSIQSGYGYLDESTKYSAYQRLNVTKTPSYICSDDMVGGNLSKLTVSDMTNGNGSLDYKVGSLTADEVMYAGGVYGIDNSNYYLTQNAVFGSYWTISPYMVDSGVAYVTSVTKTGSISYSTVTDYLYIRPIVVLNSNTIVKGSGTVSDPYIVA